MADENKYYSMKEVIKLLNVNTRNERRRLQKAISNGRFTISARHPVSNKILPYKITYLNLETEEVSGYFLDS